MSTPQTQYTKSGDRSIAYQVHGEGGRDLVIVQGFASHLDMDWESPDYVGFAEGLGAFARVIRFDKSGTGLSDRVDELPGLEARIDEVRAVMDAAGSKRATLLGISEGAPMSILLAATHPQRVDNLVLYGGMARTTWAPDYPWAAPAESLLQAATEMIGPYLYTGEDMEVWMPSRADDENVKAFAGRYRRAAASPAAMGMLYRMFLDVDVRDVLPALHVPTLVMHRRGDRVVNRHAGEWMASQIDGAKYVEFPGQDHLPWASDSASIISEIRGFLTGDRGPVAEPERVLATIMFTDIVASTERASRLGDAAWRQELEEHLAEVRKQIARYRGVEVKAVGDGIVATFDGPGRAVHCAKAINEAVAKTNLQVRIGLHCGEVEMMGDDLGGIAVHIAARIGALASANEILVSNTIRGLVAGSDIRFEDRGLQSLKGIPDEWHLFAVS